jgi:hypothetical protein
VTRHDLGSEPCFFSEGAPWRVHISLKTFG